MSTIVIIILLFIFQCFDRPNIRMRDLDVENGKFSTFLFLGHPDGTHDGEWYYINDKIKFYNIPTKSVYFNYDKNEYRIYFEDDVTSETIEEILSRHCQCIWDECSSYSSIYTYDGLMVEYIKKFNVIYVNE